jgi:hypothetical protein
MGYSSRNQRPRGLALVLLAVPFFAGCPGHLEDPNLVNPLYDGASLPVPTDAAALPGAVDAASVDGPVVGRPVGAPDGAVDSAVDRVAVDAPANDAGGRDGGGGVAPGVPLCSTPMEIQTKIVLPKCATCHGAMNPRAGLDLVSAGVKDRLLARMAMNPMCNGRALVVADPTPTGVLFDKLTGAACGNQMPFMGMPLSAAEVQCMRDWIKPAGAPTPPVSTAECSTPEAIASKILTPLCAKCHLAVGGAAGLDLASPGAKMRLLNVPAKQCMGKPLIVDSPAVGGVFFDKLAGVVPGCGNQMPLGGPYLGPMELKCLKDWIKPSP